MSINDLLAVELNDDEVRVLRHGLLEWGGPARCTHPIAQAIGFKSVDDLFEQGDRIRKALAERQPLPQRDWVRALLAAEIVFLRRCHRIGRGLGGHVRSIRLRNRVASAQSQRKPPKAGSLDVLLRLDRSD